MRGVGIAAGADGGGAGIVLERAEGGVCGDGADFAELPGAGWGDSADGAAAGFAGDSAAERGGANSLRMPTTIREIDPPGAQPNGFLPIFLVS